MTPRPIWKDSAHLETALWVLVLCGLQYGAARWADFPGWMRPLLVLSMPFLRWGVSWALVHPFRGAPLLLEYLTERVFVCILIAEFLTAPLRFVCRPPLYVAYWAAAALTVYLLNRRATHESIPVYARLAAVIVAVAGAIVMEAVQPPTPHRGLLTLAENTANTLRDLRNPPPLLRYVPYPAKPPRKPVVIPPLVLPAMLPDAAPNAVLNYYRVVQTSFRARKKRFGSLYELQSYGARFLPPPGFLLGDLDLDEIGQPIDHAGRAGLCVYPVEGRAGKLVKYGMARGNPGEREFQWKTAEADWQDVRQSLKRWPSEPRLALAPPDMTPKILATKARLSRILPTVRQFVAEQHRLPTSAEALEKFPMLSHGEIGASELLDAWARPFQFDRKPEPRAYSLGPDGQSATPDDISLPLDLD